MRGKKIKKLTLAQKAYIAGIIDGEGWVTISRKNDRTMKRGISFRPLVGVTNTNFELIEWLQKTTGLGSTNDPGHIQPNHKPMRRWAVWTQQARQLLEAVLPFLRVKRKQALLLLQLLKRQKCSNNPGSGGLSDKAWNAQVRLYEKVAFMNKRGIE